MPGLGGQFSHEAHSSHPCEAPLLAGRWAGSRRDRQQELTCKSAHATRLLNPLQWVCCSRPQHPEGPFQALQVLSRSMALSVTFFLSASPTPRHPAHTQELLHIPRLLLKPPDPLQ